MVALLVEELVEIYSTPTPNAMAKARKIVLIVCWLMSITMAGVYYCTQGLNMSPSPTRLSQTWNIRKHPKLR